MTEGFSQKLSGQIDQHRYEQELTGKSVKQILQLAVRYHLFALGASASLSPQQMLQEAQAWYRQQILPRGLTPLAHPNDPNSQRRLRLGYLSGDFRQHPVSYFIAPLIQAHDRSQVEVFCYAQVSHPDAVTEKIQSWADHWRSTVGLSDTQVAQLIQQDQIDILIDLAGQTENNRLSALALKPAPVQATYLGYFATTGLPAIDYWITDEVLHPAATAELTVEAIWRLPRCYLTYQPSLDAPAVSPPPCCQEGRITFASFNNLAKVSAATVQLWSRVLQGVPNSRLLLKTSNLANPQERERIQREFEEQGIAGERLVLRGWSAARVNASKFC